MYKRQLYVEVVGDQPEGFTPGTIRSAGDEAVTIKLAKKVDGKDNSKNYTLKFTVVNDDKTRNYDGENGYTQLHPGCAITVSYTHLVADADQAL